MTTNDEKEEKELPLWREDPKESFSDWSVEVRTNESKDEDDEERDEERDSCRTTTYRVHRIVLARGHRKSSYFAAAFRNQSKLGSDDDATNMTTCIDLEDSAAAAFPDFLDYLYVGTISDDDDKESLTPARVVSLHHLGEYFGVQPLTEFCCNFIRREMAVKELLVDYLKAIILFGHEPLLEIARIRCVQYLFDGGGRLDELVPVMDYPFFLAFVRLFSNVLEGRDPSAAPTLQQRCLSQMVMDFCVSHEEKLDRETFLQLVDPSILPIVDGSVAVTLLKLEMDLVGYSDEPTAEGAVVKLSSLQERCIRALQNYPPLLEDMLIQKEASQLFVQMPKHLSAQLLIMSLTGSLGTQNPFSTTETSAPPDPAKYQILVLGAEPLEINGLYHWDRASPSYVMDGSWEGSKQRFRIGPPSFQSNWRIMVGNPVQVLFVASSPSGPPGWGWKLEQNSHIDGVPPILLFQRATPSDEEATVAEMTPQPGLPRTRRIVRCRRSTTLRHD